MLDLVRARTEKRSEFNYGILTADRYIKRFLDEIGIQACYRHMCRTKGDWASFDDTMQKAAGTLSYINADMEVKAKGDDELPSAIERPKNTLMVFRHVLTTSKKDRDGDILRTKGAKPDPRMLMLWQHVHTLPIGKMLSVASHTKDELQLYSCIVDMNELCHDGAVMVDNGMGRFSHGFRAIDFLEIKEGRDSHSGFDVKEFEILEESIVSVPANPDAKTEEVILSLVEGGKLTSSLMKDYGRAIRERRAISVPVELDVKVTINGQEVKSDANESRDKARERVGADGASEEASADTDEGWRKEKTSKADEVKQEETYSCECLDCRHVVESKEHCRDIECPKCGGEMRRKERPGPGKKTKAKADEKPVADGLGKVECPECGEEVVPDEDGKCPKCGAAIEGEKPEEEKQGLIDDSASGGTAAAPPVQAFGREGEQMVCPECDYVGPGKNGKCPECGAKLIPRKDFVLEKLGRVLSKANEGKIRDAIDDLDEASKTEGVPRGCKALIVQARRNLGDVVSSLGDNEGVEKAETPMDTKQAMAVLLASGGKKELKVMASMLKAIEDGRRDDEMVRQYAELFS